MKPSAEYRFKTLWLDWRHPDSILQFAPVQVMGRFALPADVEFVEVSFDQERMQVGIRIASAEFDVVLPGAKIPVWGGCIEAPRGEPTRSRIKRWALENGFGCRVEHDWCILSHRQGESVVYCAVPLGNIPQLVHIDLEKWLQQEARRLVNQHPLRVSHRERCETRHRLMTAFGNHPIPPAMAPADLTLELLDALEEATALPTFRPPPTAGDVVAPLFQAIMEIEPGKLVVLCTSCGRERGTGHLPGCGQKKNIADPADFFPTTTNDDDASESITRPAE